VRPLTPVIAAALVLLTAAPASADVVNQPPVAVNDTVTYRNNSVEGAAYAVNALANDSDPDGDTLTYTAVTPAAKGNAYLQGGQLMYKPGFRTEGTDSFTYTVTDGQGNTATGTVTATLWVDPDIPGNPSITIPVPGSVTLTWSAAARADQYRIYRNNVLVDTTSGLAWSDSGLLDSRYYIYSIAGVNGGGWEGPRTYLNREYGRQTPLNLVVELIDDPTAVSLTWDASGQWGPWLVYRDGVHVGTTTESRFQESGLVTGHAYSYQVQLVDEAPRPYDYDVSPASPLSDPVLATPAPLSPIARLFWERGGRHGSLGPITVPERPIPGGRQQDHAYGTILQKDDDDPLSVSLNLSGAYTAAGGPSGDLGFPVAEQDCTLRDGGCVQVFEGGSIWRSWYTASRAVRPHIEDGWAAVDWEEGPLGYPTGDQLTLPGGVWQAFEGGGVYWSAATGSHGVSGESYYAYAAHGGTAGFLGYPTADEICGLRGDGCYQLFRGGAIYWSPDAGAHVVFGAIAAAWAQQGREGGFLGYPTTDEIVLTRGGGRYQLFQGGAVYWSSATGAHIVFGAIAATWAQQGWEGGFLGYPTTNEIVLARGGRYQGFQGGTIYWSPTTGAHIVFGAIAATWGQAGWENGYLGYPTTNEIPLARGGRYQGFQGGTIYWSPTTGAHPVAGAIAATWGQQGWENGFLGYPTTNEIPLARGGRYQAFQGGTVYWSPTTGAHAITGIIRDTWGRQGWENGRLGYPTSDERNGGGARWQEFQGGTITVDLRSAQGRISYR
jgi:uncharacterized protein with LGFP repeats